MAVWAPCICGDEIVTVTPGNTLSELSTTLPLIEPVVAPTVWPSAATGSSRAMSKTPRMFFITRLLIAPPEPPHRAKSARRGPRGGGKTTLWLARRSHRFVGRRRSLAGRASDYGPRERRVKRLVPPICTVDASVIERRKEASDETSFRRSE